MLNNKCTSFTRSYILGIFIFITLFWSYSEGRQLELKFHASEMSKENCTITETHNVNVTKTRLKKGFLFRKYLQRTPEIENYTDVEPVPITICCYGYEWKADTDFCELLCYPNCSEYGDHYTKMEDDIRETTIGSNVTHEEEVDDELYDEKTTIFEEINCPEGQIYYNNDCRSLKINNDCHLTGCPIHHSICSENGDCVCESEYESQTADSKLAMCLAKEQVIVVYTNKPIIFAIYIGVGIFILIAIFTLIWFKCLRKPRGHMDVEGKNLQCVYMKTTDAETSKDVVFKKPKT